MVDGVLVLEVEFEGAFVVFDGQPPVAGLGISFGEAVVDISNFWILFRV